MPKLQKRIHERGVRVRRERTVQETLPQEQIHEVRESAFATDFGRAGAPGAIAPVRFLKAEILSNGVFLRLERPPRNLLPQVGFSGKQENAIYSTQMWYY
jgi:hypothetical protein